MVGVLFLFVVHSKDYTMNKKFHLFSCPCEFNSIGRDIALYIQGIEFEL
jgi:hypothetical protein